MFDLVMPDEPALLEKIRSLSIPCSSLQSHNLVSVGNLSSSLSAQFKTC